MFWGFLSIRPCVFSSLRDVQGLTRIILCWIPIRVNIPGNVRADTAAKSALSLPVTKMKFPGSDFIPHVSKFCIQEWQEIRNNCSRNKLHSVYPTVGTIHHNKTVSRHETVITNRLRIGDTRMTHSYLLSGDDPPTCNSC